MTITSPTRSLFAVHNDPALLLDHLADARRDRDRAAERIRLLLAYAREHVRPCPYRLADLADASGLSLSGVRTHYDRTDVDIVAALIGADLTRTARTAMVGAEQSTQSIPSIGFAYSPEEHR
ncbi:hypothetical protein AB0M36_34730 [Actinoplanes sp. NPDC051346]|uniref:hypothetical protein n=1 Tax=Actinoplanes sp. NPDC051346 TaxID=3155048 RepID=UPI0034318149